MAIILSWVLATENVQNIDTLGILSDTDNHCNFFPYLCIEMI